MEATARLDAAIGKNGEMAEHVGAGGCRLGPFTSRFAGIKTSYRGKHRRVRWSSRSAAVAFLDDFALPTFALLINPLRVGAAALSED